MMSKQPSPAQKTSERSTKRVRTFRHIIQMVRLPAHPMANRPKEQWTPTLTKLQHKSVSRRGDASFLLTSQRGTNLDAVRDRRDIISWRQVRFTTKGAEEANQRLSLAQRITTQTKLLAFV